jgi:hypothetical protein
MAEEGTTNPTALTPEFLAEDAGHKLIEISVAFAALTTVVLGLRIYAKRFQAGGWGLDDVFLIAAYVVNLGMCAIGIRTFPRFS